MLKKIPKLELEVIHKSPIYFDFRAAKWNHSKVREELCGVQEVRWRERERDRKLDRLIDR